MKTVADRPFHNFACRLARHSRLSHALEQTVTNILYAILVGGICVILFS